MEQSLALSLSARDVSLEEARAQYLENKRRMMKPEHERAVTAYTQGFARAGDWGGVFSWAFEWVHYCRHRRSRRPYPLADHVQASQLS